MHVADHRVKLLIKQRPSTVEDCRKFAAKIGLTESPTVDIDHALNERGDADRVSTASHVVIDRSEGFDSRIELLPPPSRLRERKKPKSKS